MAGLLAENESFASALAAGEVSRTFIDAITEAANVASLALQGDTLLACSTEFVRLCEVPQHVLERGTGSALIDWLRQRPDESAVAMATLLANAPQGDARGELPSSSGRVLEWRKVALRAVRGCVWVFVDVSEQRQLAAALVNADSWLRVLEAHVHGVLLELDSEARIVSLWAHGHAFFDEPDGALEGKRLADAVPGREGAELDARIRRVFQTGRREEYEYPALVGGQARVLAASAVLMPGGEGAARRVTLMLRDITERAHMQAQLLQVERLATVGLLAAGTAHEINNPLAYVLLNLQRLRSGLAKVQGGPSPAELGELSAAIEMSIEGASRVQAIVRDLNQFSRSDDSQLLPVDVHRALDFALAMAEPQIATSARLTRDFGEAPPVRASETRLSQVFLNLIINAAHAVADAPGSRGEIRVVTRTSPSGQAVVEVHDTGPGIAPDARRRIFEPFYTTKAPGRGTGLGLTICHDIVTTLAGSIEVESSEGGGSLFRVLLPSASDP